MSFVDAVKSVFSQYAKFDGRARRSEYWYFFLFNAIISGVLSGITKATGSTVFSIISGLYSLAVLVPALAVSWRRMHDIGKSGAFYLINLIPIAGWIIFIVFAAKDSQPGDNQYGPNPKGL